MVLHSHRRHDHGTIQAFTPHAILRRIPYYLALKRRIYSLSSPVMYLSVTSATWSVSPGSLKRQHVTARVCYEKVARLDLQRRILGMEKSCQFQRVAKSTKMVVVETVRVINVGPALTKRRDVCYHGCV